MFGKFLERIHGQLAWLVSSAHRKSLSHVFHISGVRDDGNGALDPSALNRETPTVASHLPEAPIGILSVTPINTQLSECSLNTALAILLPGPCGFLLLIG